MISRHTQIALALVIGGIFSVAFYMLHLKNQAEERAPRASSERPLAAPIATGPPEPVTLFVAYDGDGVMRQRVVNAALPIEASQRDREVLRTLLGQYVQRKSSHPMPEGAEIADVYLVNRSIAVVDLNSAFAEGHRSGVWVEALTINSFVATLAANDNAIRQVKFLVNGKERETLAGHADLVQLYDVAQVQQVVRSLQ